MDEINFSDKVFEYFSMYNYKNIMSDDFIEMINDIDFSYEFIYECANLVNTLYYYSDHNHLPIK